MNTALRKRFNDYLTLQRYSDRTIGAYLQAVNALARHYHQSPDKLNDQQIQTYLLHLLQERKLSWNSCNVAFSALNHFYLKFLKRKSGDFWMPPRPRLQKLPEVLSRDEVLSIIEAGRDVRHQALLAITYGSGLRVGELVALRIAHIDSGRMLVRVEQGKGRKDRYTLLSQRALDHLRLYWRAFRPKSYIFFGRCRDLPMSITTAQRIYNQAKKAAGVTRGKGIHTLRHCFATHLLEQGVDIYYIKNFLGHSSIQTTMVYFHVQPNRSVTIHSPLDAIDKAPGGDHESAPI